MRAARYQSTVSVVASASVRRGRQCRWVSALLQSSGHPRLVRWCGAASAGARFRRRSVRADQHSTGWTSHRVRVERPKFPTRVAARVGVKPCRAEVAPRADRGRLHAVPLRVARSRPRAPEPACIGEPIRGPVAVTDEVAGARGATPRVRTSKKDAVGSRHQARRRPSACRGRAASAPPRDSQARVRVDSTCAVTTTPRTTRVARRFQQMGGPSTLTAKVSTEAGTRRGR